MMHHDFTVTISIIMMHYDTHSLTHDFTVTTSTSLVQDGAATTRPKADNSATKWASYIYKGYKLFKHLIHSAVCLPC